MKSSIKHTISFLGFVLLFCLLNNSAISQERAGKFGIGVIASSSSQDLLFKYWLSSSFSLQPAFGFSIVSPDEGETVSNFRLGFGLLGYKSGQLSPYYGFRFSANILSGGGESNSDILIAGVFGAEYFFSEKFSIGGEFQLILGLADDEFSPSGFSFGSTNYFTGQFATFNFYFK